MPDGDTCYEAKSSLESSEGKKPSGGKVFQEERTSTKALGKNMLRTS